MANSASPDFVRLPSPIALTISLSPSKGSVAGLTERKDYLPRRPFLSEFTSKGHLSIRSVAEPTPPEFIRALDFTELDVLWEASQKTLKIITLAPETLIDSDLERLTKWARKNAVSLSIGHSKATEKLASQAFSSGFRGITHAWNALSFHQRAPGSIAAAFKNPESYIEIIVDQVHVAPSVISWTETLQPLNRLCYVSDCVPAAETSPGMITSFGPLKILYSDGACRLVNGALAGGGKVLTHAFSEWISTLSGEANPKPLLKTRLPCITEAPLSALGFKRGPFPELKSRTVSWHLQSDGSISVTSL